MKVLMPSNINFLIFVLNFEDEIFIKPSIIGISKLIFRLKKYIIYSKIKRGGAHTFFPPKEDTKLNFQSIFLFSDHKARVCTSVKKKKLIQILNNLKSIPKVLSKGIVQRYCPKVLSKGPIFMCPFHYQH